MSLKIYTVADEIDVWVEQGTSIHIKMRKPHGDPVELGESEVERLIEILSFLLKEIR